MLHPLAVQELKKNKIRLIGLLTFNVFVICCIILQAFIVAYLVNGFFLESLTVAEAEPYFFALVAIVAGRAIFQYIREYMALRLGQITKQNLRDQLITHLMMIGPLSGERHGETVHLLTEGLDSVEDYISRYIPQMLYSVLIPVVIAIAMMITIPWVGIILLISYPLIPFFMILIGKRAGAMNEAQWEKMSFLSGHFLDVLQGLTTLKVFHRSKEQEAVIARLAGEFRDVTLQVLRVAFLSSFVLELAGTISTAMIAVYTGVALLYYKVTFFSAFFVLLLSPEFYLPLRELGSAFHTGMAGETALKKVTQFLQIPIREPKSGPIAEDISIEQIRFSQVSYTYDDTEAAALTDFSVPLLRDKPVMLVGESGAGKSTVANLLLRLIAPQEGQILINEKDLAQYDIQWWRNQIVYVPQRPYLFSGSIRENISFGTDADMEQIKAAAIQAEAHEFIMQRPNGYEEHIGEGGQGLSGGEIQRIALARAFLRTGQVLIFDEVTSHLDVKTERAIGLAIQRLMAGKIALFIGHRLETMQWGDTLLVMHAGKVVQRGTFDEMSQQEGYFKDLMDGGSLYHEST